jgi:hypothetical protein
MFMLTGEIIKTMKRNNISANGELTKKRFKELIQSATNEQKKEIDKLTDLKRVSILRVYETGSISAKISVAAAQVLNVNPFYLTGEAGEKGECNDETLSAFLNEKGYTDLLKPAKPSRRRSTAPAKDKTAGQAPAVEENKTVEPTATKAPPKPQLPIKNITKAPKVTEEEAVQLLHALFLRAKYSGDAKNTLDMVCSLLV